MTKYCCMSIQYCHVLTLRVAMFFFKEISISIPDDLNLSEISSSVSVVETDFWVFIDKLNSLYEKKKLDDQIEKINISFSNLNFQIDKIHIKKK